MSQPKAILEFVLTFAMFGVHTANAQPYYFRSSQLDDPKYSLLYRVNLANNESQLFLSDTMIINDVESDPGQNWVYLYLRNEFQIVDASNPSTFYEPLRGKNIDEMPGILFLPRLNRFYITWFSKEKGEWMTNAAMFDGATLHMFDSPLGIVRHCINATEDESMIYEFRRDSTGYESIVGISTTTNLITREIPFSSIGSPTEMKITNDGKNGKLLFSYNVPEDGKTVFAHYQVIDLTTGDLFPPITFLSKSEAYLTWDTKHVVVEEVAVANSPYGKYLSQLGNVYIYETATGKLEQRLTLPKDGKVLVFSNYPNMLYYYLPAEQRSINIDLSKLANITSLSPAFAYAGSNAFTLAVNGKNFANGSIVNWGGVAKTTTFISDTLLQASILASDIAAIDSPLVTVKNFDGSAESNGVCFYIKQPPPITGCNVKLINSSGTKLIGGSLQYYEGGWKDAVNNNDGTFFVNTTARTISLRMTYEYGTETKSNVTVGPDTVVFQTVNAQIQLQDSRGSLIDTGTVQYYAGAWRSLGTTVNGIASKELLPGSYSFRMTYAYASKDKQQDIGTNSIVVFQTVSASVQLQDSQGTLMDQGTVQYYSGAWRDFGVTASGVARKELLPNNYSFRMTYAYASKDKQQDIGANPTVVFQTVNAVVQLQNSQGNLMHQGTVQYYSGAWRDFGITASGVATKELLPNNYSFRMTYAYASKDKQQDIGTNPVVVFQTVNATVQLRNSQGSLIDQGMAQYYSGAWRDFGVTTGGVTAKELLPNNYSFRMTYEFVSNDKVQDISSNSTVKFSTVLCTVRVKDAQNQPVDGAQASYYSGAWRQIGATVNGEVTKELLPANLTFRITYGTTQQDKTQNLSTSNVVEFTIGP